MSEKPTITRAEEVRQRRAREQSRRQKQASERAYRPLPPVTARRTGFAVAKQKRKPANRRFQIAVGLPQARLHVPVLPQWKTGPRLASFILVLMLGTAIYLAWGSPTFCVTEAQVNGAARLSPAEINAALDISGQPIFMLRPDEIAARLRLTYPELAGAQVTIGLPNQVQVRVTERQPVIMWQQGSGYTWVDATGVAFHPRGQVDGLIPVVALAAPPGGSPSPDDPYSPPPYVAPDLVKAVLTLAPNVPPGSSLIYDPLNGLGWTDSRGWQVYFGKNPKDMVTKLRVYQALVDSLSARGLSPIFISVVHAEAPYYRMVK